MTFRRFRILLLLAILAAAWGTAWFEQTRVRGWGDPLEVQIIPINGDGSTVAAETIRLLTVNDFDDVNAFLERETMRYGVRQTPALKLTLMPELSQSPPAPPRDGSVLKTMLWSMQLRWWVYRQSGQMLPQLGTIKLFVLYHAPQEGLALAHSLGQQKGLIGVVHAFASADQARQNNIVLAHELLHTLGATDKYDAEGRPVYPQGYADAALPPSLPRNEAEIMAGRYLAANGQAVMPVSLERCIIGAQTAHEINLDEGFRRRFAPGS